MTLRKLEDGLTKSEIQQLVRDSSATRDGALDKKLEAHKEEIKGIVDALGRKVDSMGEDVCILVGNDRFEGLANQQVRLQKESMAQAAAWHDADMQFRGVIRDEIKAVDARVAVVEETVTAVADKVDHLNWLVGVTRVFGAVGNGIVKSATKGRDLWKVGTFFLTAWVCCMQFLNLEVPSFDRFTKAHHILTICVGVSCLLVGLFFAVMSKGKKKAEEDSEAKPAQEG